MTLRNRKVVVGIPENIRRVENVPLGARVRFRFRSNQLARCFVKTRASAFGPCSIAEGILWDLGSKWRFEPQAANVRL